MRCTSHSATSTSRVASSLVAVAALKPMLRCSQSPNCVIARSRYEGLPFLPTMTTYARRLGLFSGTMAVVGGIIGGGIFRTPAVVAERVGSARLALGARLLGGVVAPIGALCYGEPGQRRPPAGGGHVYPPGTGGAPPPFPYGRAPPP